ncbi:MAG: ABC transporter ATP-binding protein [Alphaproteobacteria bacterium]
MRISPDQNLFAGLRQHAMNPAANPFEAEPGLLLGVARREGDQALQVAARGRDEQARQPMLNVRELVIEFPGARGPRRAVDAANLLVERCETLALLGPSAAGKTVLLRAIAGLEPATSGFIALDGNAVYDSVLRHDAPAERRGLALVTDIGAPWPRTSVGENVALPIEDRGLTNPVVRARVAAALAKVGLAHCAELPVAELSAGQQQRVALARALLKNPGLLLLDEAMSCLDPRAREEIRAELNGLGKTVLYATHDQEGALAMAGRIAVMRAGRIVECGTPIDLYLRPRHPFTARFLGHALLIEGRRLAGTGEGVVIETDIGSFVAAQATHDGPNGFLMIRPEFIEMAGRDTSAANLVDGTVRAAAFGGRMIEYTVETGRRLLRVQRPVTRLYTEGESVRLRLPAERCGFLPLDDS